MRKVIVSEFVTLDGVMEDPCGAKNSNTAVGAFNSSMKSTRSINSMSYLRATLCSGGE